MFCKWDTDIREIEKAQSELEEFTKKFEGSNRQAWIKQKEINERLISFIERLKKKRKGLFGKKGK